VRVDIAPVFAAYLARNRGPVSGNPDVRHPPDYGVSARLHGAVVKVALTFRAGSANWQSAGSRFHHAWSCA
jgi:hypothetical protein